MARLLILLLLALAIAHAAAWSGPLQFPELHPPKELNAKQKEHFAHLTRFMRQPMKFLDGRFFGAHSHHFRLGGTMADAASCIWLIKEVGVWELVVVASPLGRDDVALEISQYDGGKLTIVINSGRGDYVARDFERFDPKKPGVPTKKIKE